MSENAKNKSNRPNPTAANAASTSTRSSAIQYRFIEGYLAASDQQWLTDNMDSSAECVLELVSTISEGYKFGLSFDSKSGRFLATLTCSLVGSADFGKILTSRGATPMLAAFALWYRHYRKFSNGWGESQRNGSLFD